MFNFKSMRKTKLSLALSAVIAGGMFSSSAQAVQIAQDGLGDAAIFPYFTVNNGWQTFIRVMNTSDQSVLIKVRLREADNSRELRDFIVALSPNDMWTAWTDDRALNGQPGIRSNDTSCIFDLVNTGPETFQTISGDLKGLAFADRTFTGDYDDGSDATSAARLQEGYIEIIGIAAFDPNTSTIGRNVVHGANGYPENCAAARNAYRADADANINSGLDVPNALGFNAQLINVGNGEGAGYDPTVLANFQDDPLTAETGFRLAPTGVGHGSWPSLDSADPNSVVLTANGTAIASVWDADGDGQSTFGGNDVAAQQLLANGTPASMTLNVVDLNGDGDTIDIVNVENSDTSVLSAGVDESDVPGAVINAITGRRLANIAAPGGAVVAPAGNANVRIVANLPGNNDYVATVTQNTVSVTAANPARLTNIPHDNSPVAATAVRGGVDAVSAVLARRSVVNEWAASSNPGAAVSDYYTQWVLTFPTKHYYVDLQDDPDNNDIFAPTLQDPRGDANDMNDAFAPFSQEFNIAGESCEAYDMMMYDREESELGYTSPVPLPEVEICSEVNVVAFTNAYASAGFNSNFNAVVPDTYLPPNALAGSVFQRSTRGFAEMTFTGDGANTGLTGVSNYATIDPNLGGAPSAPFISAPEVNVRYQGLPVIGFGLTSYGTGSTANNHNAINEHKYTREIQDITIPADL